MYKTTRLLGAGLLAAALTGCSGSRDFTPTEGMAPDQVFAQACASCHGEAGEGKFGFLLAVAGTETGVEEIVAKIRSGGHVMPAFPNIDENTATAIAAYLKSR